MPSYPEIRRCNTLKTEAEKAAQKRWISKNRNKVLGYQRNYYLDNKPKIRLQQNKYKLELKQSIMQHYGNGKCLMCGFANIQALTIDHVNGGGSNHRKTIGVTGSYSFYRWLVNNQYPDGYQCLCMNCQMIKRHNRKEHVAEQIDSKSTARKLSRLAKKQKVLEHYSSNGIVYTTKYLSSYILVSNYFFFFLYEAYLLRRNYAEIHTVGT